MGDRQGDEGEGSSRSDRGKIKLVPPEGGSSDEMINVALAIECDKEPRGGAPQA